MRGPDSLPATPAAAPAITGDFARHVLAGLAARPRSIPPKFFYDAAGSVLFDRICELPEYYPTRTELAILAAEAPSIAACIGAHADIVEFGAGSTQKVRLLLDALESPRRFVPVDISAEHMQAAARQLQADYPGLVVHPLAADYTCDPPLPPPLAGAVRRVGFFPGSSIGNFTPDEAVRFLQGTLPLLRGGGLLVGVDLVKDPVLLHAAYNDAAGVTAAFNRNLLVRANRELGADFDPERFDHYAFYHPVRQRIEMHLLSREAQRVHVCGREFTFEAGETLHTENSYKYTLPGFRALAARAGYVPGPVWCDPVGLFSVHWLEAPQ